MTMKRLRGFGMMGIILSITFGIMGFAGLQVCNAEGPVVTWKMQSVFPPPEKVLDHLGVYGQAAELVKRVKERTNGKFDIKLYIPRSIGIGSREALNAAKKGAVDMAVGGGVYGTSLIPEARIQHGGLPYGAKTPEDGAKIILNTDFVKVLRQAYAERTNTYLLGLTSSSSATYITNDPIRKFEDLKGKKIRVSGGLTATVAAQGATPVSIAPAELYLALQRGTIDGTMFPPYAGVSYKLFEVSKHVSIPYTYAYTAMDWVVNMDAWNKLPADFKKILQEEMDKMSKFSYEENGPQLEIKTKQEGEKIYNVQFVEISDEEFEKFRKAVMPVWDDMASISENAAKLVKIIKDSIGVE